MKKLLLVLAIGAFVACNDDGEGDGGTGDSITPSSADTAIIAPVDTSRTDTSGVKPDSTIRK